MIANFSKAFGFAKPLCFLVGLASATTASGGGWLPREVHEVRAYVYDFTQEDGNISLLKGGRIHRGVINQGGAPLSEVQIDRLRKALKSTKERTPGAFCYLPHHGFVFFDAKGVPMGHIELCFQCGNVAHSPPGLPEREWNWKELLAILEELGIPILKTDAEYTALCEKSKNQQ